MSIKEGSIWEGGDKKFRVISVSEVQGHTWVYYREEPQKWKPMSELKEFSCYQESFLQRFRSLPE
jgi:hypothetical protein